MPTVLKVLSETSPCVRATAVTSGASQAGSGGDEEVRDIVIKSPALIFE